MGAVSRFYWVAFLFFNSYSSFAATFEPISLQDAMLSALRNNPSIEVAQANAAAAKYTLESAWMRLLPSVTFSQSWGENGSSNSNTPPTSVPVFTPKVQTMTYGFSIPIFDGGATIALIQQAQASKKQAQQNQLAVSNAILLQVVQVYSTLVLAYGELSYFEIIQEKLNQLLKAADQSPAGKSNPVRSAIQNAISQNNLQIRNINRGLADARLTYFQLIQEDAPSEGSKMISDQEIIQLLSIPEETVISENLLKETPTMRIAEAVCRVAHSNTQLEIARDLPRLMFSQSWSRTNREFTSSSEPFTSKSNNGGITLSVTFSFGGVSSRAAAREREKASQASFKVALNNLSTLIHQAYNRDRTLGEDRKDQLNNIRASFESAKADFAAIEAGEKVNLLAVKDNVVNISNTVLQFVSTEQQWITARAQIMANLGDLVKVPNYSLESVDEDDGFMGALGN